MLYNGPLDQPSNPNAPYIDGNPAAGIEGSIVPAAQCEFPQREIIEVINQANLRGYSDFAGVPCPSPSNADLVQLRKAIEGYITDWQFLITTYVTFKVHGPGADFSDLNAAMVYLSKYKITSTGHVTLQMAGATSGLAQVFTYSQPILFDHPNNDRISLLGAPMLGALTPDDSGYAWSGPSAAQRQADTATNLQTLRGKFATELHFPGLTAPVGITINGQMLADFDGLLLTSDGANAGSAGVSFRCLGYFNSSVTRPMMGMAAVSFAYGFNFDTGAAISNYATGSNSSPVANATWLAIGCSQMGIIIGNGSFFCTVHNLICLSNVNGGFWVYPRGGCQIDAPVFCNANAQWGITADFASNVFLGSGTFGLPGYFSHCYRNGNWGIFANQSNVTFAGDFGGAGYQNASGSCYAQDNSSIALYNSINVGTCSPAFGVLGNNAAMISG
ncbi:MAG TPA: hypothetical protein VGH47_04395 [Xanthobacteraceae bacterium]|jgi:hypothetical protein